jgi:glycosyltransferase involved in cell wall biosynthesis
VTYVSTVDVILPCLDEAAALPGVLAGIPPGFGAVVVDNGSTDGSDVVAAQHGATVVREPRRGYGAAVHAGVERSAAEIVCVLDADGSLSAQDLLPLVDAVTNASVDLAVGRRVPLPGAWPTHARAANALLAKLLRHKGIPVRDIGAIRVARRVELLALNVRDRAFGYPLEVLIRAAAANWTIREFDVGYGPRAAGTRSKVTGTVRGTARAVRDMSAVLR